MFVPALESAEKARVGNHMHGLACMHACRHASMGPTMGGAKVMGGPAGACENASDVRVNPFHESCSTYIPSDVLGHQGHALGSLEGVTGLQCNTDAAHHIRDFRKMHVSKKINSNWSGTHTIRLCANH